jgi:hypothetical protein
MSKRNDNDAFYSLTSTDPAGLFATTVCPVSDVEVLMRYLTAHAWVPEGVELWSEQQLREVAASVEEGMPQTWERALIILAHHGSRLACDLIARLAEKAPPELREFCDHAYGEGLSWLGQGHVRDEEGGLTIFGMGEEGPAN